MPYVYLNISICCSLFLRLALIAQYNNSTYISVKFDHPVGKHTVNLKLLLPMGSVLDNIKLTSVIKNCK